MWPVAIPDTVSVPTQAAVSSMLRADRMLGRSIPLEQIDAALAEFAKSRTDALRAMKELRKVRQIAKRERDAAARQAAKYAREEDRLTRDRDARVTGERMAASLGIAA